MTHNFRADISYGTALAAYKGTSFSPEKRAEQCIEDYVQCMTADYQIVESIQDADRRAKAEELFQDYREGHKARFLGYLHSRAGMISPMIAGPSNFPAQRQRKHNNRVDARMEDLIDYRNKMISKLKKIKSGREPIKSSDSDAVEKLKDKIQKAKEWQEKAKAVNKIVKRKRGEPEDKKAEIMELGYGRQFANAMLTPDYMGRLGVPDYELTNNRQNIKRLEKRLEEIQETKTADTERIEGSNGIVFEDDPPANRVRLYFPDKPEEDVRSDLKSHGFRWARSIGAWQAYRNNRAIDKARKYVE